MPFTRRQFCAVSGAMIGAASLPANEISTVPASTQSMRVIAYNVYGCTGWPKDRKRAKSAVKKGQMAKRLAMELALYEPDIINFSESPGESLVEEIANQLDMHYVYFPSGGSWPGTLLSRYPIAESRNVPLDIARPKELFTRHWGRAIVNIPNGRLIVHSAHLFPTADPKIRLREIAAMLDSMKADLDAGNSMLLIGDLNHGPESAEYKLWIDAGWQDTFVKAGKGNGLTIKSDLPKWRIDYVMAAGPVANQVTESRPLFEGAFRLHIADQESFALSDHLPQFAVFEFPAKKS